jgi:flagellar basal-body rod protein FlgB|uniref:Flagellar basal body rod protein FlgB n=1 Tax=Desulfobacca acetoxidans TaxID=60893 RepID=A0A7C3Z9N4_9BACT
MPDDLFLDSTMRLLEKSLSWRSQGQAIIAGNLANLETPNYTRQEVNFQGVLKDHLQGHPGIRLAASHPQHLQGISGTNGLVRESDDPPDLDQEMINLSLNQLGYQTSVTMLNKKLNQMRTVLEK